jgi:hypothetical protein
MTLATDLQQAATRIKAASAAIKSWATAGATTDVSLPGGGSMPSLRKQLVAAPNVNTIGEVAFTAVNTVEDIKALSKTKHRFVRTVGYANIFDRGGATYFLNPDDTNTTGDDWRTIVANDGGRWFLIPDRVLNVRVAGVRGDGSADDTVKLKALLDLLGHSFTEGFCTLFFPNGIYQITLISRLQSGARVVLRGENRYGTIIRFATGGEGPALTFETIFAPYDLSIENLTIEAPTTGSSSRSFLLCSGFREFSLKNVSLKNAGGDEFVLLEASSHASAVGKRSVEIINVTMNGRTVNDPQNFTEGGIRIYNVDKGILRNVRVTDVLKDYNTQILGRAFHFIDSSNVVMEDCQSENCGTDLVLENCSNFKVLRQRATGLRGTALDLINSNDCTFHHRGIVGGGLGDVVKLTNSNRNRVTIDRISNVEGTPYLFSVLSTSAAKTCSYNLLHVRSIGIVNSAVKLAMLNADRCDNNELTFGPTESPLITPFNITNQAFVGGANSTCKSSVYRLGETRSFSGGAITVKPSSEWVYITNSSGDVATINMLYPVNGQKLALQKNSGGSITVKHGTGNIRLNGAVDRVLSSNNATLTLRCHYTGTGLTDFVWVQESFSDNG